MRIGRAIDVVVQSLRPAWRGLRRASGMTALIVGMLACGMGAATAIFSMANVLLFRPVPGVPDAPRIVSVERAGGVGVIDTFSFPDYTDLRDRVSADIDLAAFRRTSLDVRAGASERVSGALVSGTYFDVLGQRTAIGRTLTIADEGSDVAVVSHGWWRRSLGGDPNAIGRTIFVNRHPFTVVGVLSPPFSGTYPGQDDVIWLPMSAQPVALPRMSAGVLANRNSRWVQIIGRVRGALPLSAVAGRLEVAGRAIAAAYPGDHAEGRFTARQGLGLASDDRADAQRLLWLLSAAAALLLLIACGNAANLLLARAEDRRREVAIRRALGASGYRIAGALLTEGALLTGTAAAAALWLAAAILRWLTPLSAPAYGVRADAFGVDARACVFAIALSGGITILFTIVALSGASHEPATVIRTGGRGLSTRRTTLRSSLVATQVGLSVMLTIGAGLSLKTLARIASLEPGYATSGIVMAGYALDLHGYTPARASGFFSRLTTAMRTQPDVAAVSWATAVPPVAYGGRRSVFRAGEAPPQAELQRREAELGIRADLIVAGPEFFDAMRIAIERGRAFDDRDRAGTEHVAVVNRALADRLWPGEDAVGRSLEAPPYSGPIPAPFQVIGVATDTRHRSLLSDTTVPVLYLPFLQAPDTRATVLISTTAPTAAVAQRLRQAAAAVDPDVPEISIEEIGDYAASTLWQQRSAAAAFGLFAACGLLVAAIGVYAALAHDVASRTRELAVRAALGASSRDIAMLVVTEGVRASLVGAAIGVVVALSASGYLRAMLFGVDPRDPLTFVIAPVSLLSIAAAACAVPARRAVRADPAAALRQE